MKRIDTSEIKDLRQALTIIEKLNDEINRHEEALMNYALDLWEGMEFILQDEKLFPTINMHSLKVYDPVYNEYVPVDVMADNIVCICAEPKTRKKHIYTYETDSKIRHFIINDNETTFTTLLEKLDKFSTHLVIVSKSAIANVKFYDKVQNKFLNLKRDYKFNAQIIYKPLKISPKIGLENFIKVNEGYENRILLHNRAFHYRNSIGLK